MRTATRSRDIKGRFIKQGGGIMQSDEEFEIDMWEISDMADQMPDAIKACDDMEALRRVGAL
jgi:hypothetical protein